MGKIIVFGTGYLATNFYNYLKENDLMSENFIFLGRKNYKKFDNFKLCDLTNYENVSEIIKLENPEFIINFTGKNFGSSLEELIRYNVLNTKNILDAVIENKVKSKVFIMGSAAEYGLINKNVSEGSILNPLSNYGLSKVYQYYLCKSYFSKVDIVYSRIFNIFGENQQSELLFGKIQNEIIDILKNNKEQLELFNLTAFRDFIYAQDVVEIIYKLIFECFTGVINIGRGIPVQVNDIVMSLLSKFENRIKYKINNKKYEDGDMNYSCSDNSLLKSIFKNYKFTEYEFGIDRINDEIEKNVYR